MNVFISWAGTRSKAVAQALHGWLPSVLQAINPWLSASDIEAGARWSTDLTRQLEQTRFGILCLTPDNLARPWVLFEAGALSKFVDNTFVCPYLLDLSPSDIEWPLAQFQAAPATEEGTRRLIHSLNGALEQGGLPAERLDETFGVWWPKLAERLAAVPRSDQPRSDDTRTDRAILEEILELLRAQTRPQALPNFLVPTDLAQKAFQPMTFYEAVGALTHPAHPGMGANYYANLTPEARVEYLERLIESAEAHRNWQDSRIMRALLTVERMMPETPEGPTPTQGTTA